MRNKWGGTHARICWCRSCEVLFHAGGPPSRACDEKVSILPKLWGFVCRFSRWAIKRDWMSAYTEYWKRCLEERTSNRPRLRPTTTTTTTTTKLYYLTVSHSIYYDRNKNCDALPPPCQKERRLHKLLYLKFIVIIALPTTTTLLR